MLLSPALILPDLVFFFNARLLEVMHGDAGTVRVADEPTPSS